MGHFTHCSRSFYCLRNNFHIKRMRFSCGKLIIVLVCIVIILQILHISLLSRLDSKTHHNANAMFGAIIGANGEDFIKTDRDRMRLSLMNTGVVDSSGEFNIIRNLVTSETLEQPVQSHDDITVITQASVDNLHHLVLLSQRWKGPIAVTVFVSNDDLSAAIDTIGNLRRCFFSIRQNVTFHLVHPLSHPPSDLDLIDTLLQWNCADYQSLKKRSAVNYSYKGLPFPVNLLRNVAKDVASTQFVFIVDVDMVPNVNLHADFLKFARQKNLFEQSSDYEDKTVYVVPAFEIKENSYIPKHKKELIPLLEEMSVRPFYYEMCWKCQKHSGYDSWQRDKSYYKETQVLFEILWQDPWEPFYIGKKNVPMYDERFKQYGFNRISQVCELHVAGYRFSVLNNAFLVHRGFKSASSFHKEKDQDNERNKLLYRQFKTELKEKYKDSSRHCY